MLVAVVATVIVSVAHPDIGNAGVVITLILVDGTLFLRTALLILPAWAVLNIITHQSGGDTETALTAELPRIGHGKVEIESSVLFSLAVIAGAPVGKMPFLSPERILSRAVLHGHQGVPGDQKLTVKFPPGVLSGVEQLTHTVAQEESHLLR